MVQTKKTKKVQRVIILNCAGPQVVKLAKQCAYENKEEKDNPDVLLMKIAQYCHPRQNEIMQSFRFWKTNFYDPFDSFLNELRDKAAFCNFKDTDRMIEDKLVFSVKKICFKLQQILLREENLTFKKAVQIYQAYEMANRNVTKLQSINTLVNKDLKRNYSNNRVYLIIMSTQY